MNIEELVDYPALHQLGRALWREGTARGAAVLVGAGFSRNAVLSGADTPKPPLWSTLWLMMAAQLYRDTNDAPRDPLRLAEEYRTNLGQAALDEFVRTTIRDAAWNPGKLHQDLLELPWSDVLTTNWDTLLERTRTTSRRETVRSTADLAHGRENRVIKLHGTVGVSEHFIFAEEDYRTYPTRFAAFVNTARQIFIENELCLIGFSGDDPNFLQWSGWVRDHLGESARRIYLVGALDLRATKRKFLESRNIAPIDLAPLVEGDSQDERQACAATLFLEYLAKAKPRAVYDWRPASPSTYSFMPTSMEDHQRLIRDAAYAASIIDQASDIWRKDRESYPHWLVCPPGLRDEMHHGTVTAQWQRNAALNLFQPLRRAEVLYEIVWRHSMAFEPIDERLAEMLVPLADPAQPCGLKKQQQLEIALALLRSARQRHNDEGFARWISILENHAEPESDLRAQATYQLCLRARDHLDFRALAAELRRLNGSDPIWKLRRAALHCELGHFSEASTLITDARSELLERQRQDYNSLWVRSRLAWAEWLFRAAQRDWSVIRQPWTLEFEQTHCDPEIEIERITDAAAQAVRKQIEEDVPIIPLFEAGHYKDPSNTIRFRSGPSATHLDKLDNLIEVVGLPLHLNHFDIVGNAKADAGALVFQPTFDWYVWLLRILQNQLDRLFDRYFGRVAVARLPANVACALSDRVTAAISYWLEKMKSLGPDHAQDRGFAVERLRLFIAALSHLSLRQDTQRAVATFELAMNLAREPLPILLIEPIGDLGKFSVEAVSPPDRVNLVLAGLECPLSTEKGGINGPWPWLNPVEWLFNVHPVRPEGDTRWAHRVGQLLREAAAGAPGRQEAAPRLGHLAINGALTEPEKAALGAALWSSSDASAASWPAGTNLFAHTFAELPAPEGVNREALVRAHLFDTNIGELLKQPQPLGTREIADKHNRLREIIAAAASSLRPTREEAIRLFVEMTDWASAVATDASKADPMGASFHRLFYTRAKNYIGVALARLVVPALPPEDRTEERARALLAFINEPCSCSAVAALPYFAHHTGPIRADIIRRIRRGIIGREFDEVSGSATAVEVWATLYPADAGSGLPDQLIEQMISAVEIRHSVGLHALIHCVGKLVEINRLRSEDAARLDEALGDLIAETAYDRVDYDSRDAASVSLVRAECVRLARALQNSAAGGANADAWLSIADTDPLPEVRYALA